MQRTTFILTLLSTYLLFSCESESSEQSIHSKKRYPDHPNYMLIAEQTGYEEASEYDMTRFGIRMILTSKYDTLPPFIYMTCSWGRENGITSEEDYYVGYHGCDANFWGFNNLKLGDTLVIKTVVGNEELTSDFEEGEIRIGFGIVDTLTLSYGAYWHSDNSQESDQWEDKYRELANSPDRIVWSNPIKLQKLDAPIGHGGRVDKIRHSR